jgi:superfamily I DNA/RNA helicase
VDLVRSSPTLFQKRQNVDILTQNKFVSNKKRYNFVFVDEIQDIELSELKKIQKLCDRIFVAGDYDQHIYPSKKTSEEDIYECFNKQNVRTETLTQVFRITKNICLLAKHIYPNANLVEGLVSTKKNSTINLVTTSSIEDEYDWIIENATTRAYTGKPSAVLLSTNDKIFEFFDRLSKYTKNSLFIRPRKTHNRYLYNNITESYSNFNQKCIEMGLPYRYIGKGVGSIAEAEKKPVVFITSIHNAKGLDFNNVFIPNLDHGEYFLSNDSNDPMSQRLILVAITRSRENLYLSYHTSKPKDFMKTIPPQLVHSFHAKPLKPGGQDTGVNLDNDSYDEPDLF